MSSSSSTRDWAKAAAQSARSWLALWKATAAFCLISKIRGRSAWSPKLSGPGSSAFLPSDGTYPKAKVAGVDPFTELSRFRWRLVTWRALSKGLSGISFLKTSSIFLRTAWLRSKMPNRWWGAVGWARAWCHEVMPIPHILLDEAQRHPFEAPLDNQRALPTLTRTGQSPFQPSLPWFHSQLRSSWTHPKLPKRLSSPRPIQDRRCPGPRCGWSAGSCGELPPSRTSVLLSPSTVGTWL